MRLYISIKNDKFQLLKTYLPKSITILRKNSFSLKEYNRITADFRITELPLITDIPETLKYPHEKMIILGNPEDNLKQVIPFIQRSVKYFPHDSCLKEIYTYMIQHYHYYKTHLNNEPVPINNKIVGSSQHIHNILKEVSQYGPTNESVTILGETGSGKELIALALHECHGYSDKFVAKNCSAIPDDLLESELFGTRKGAFTGSMNRPGLFQEAHKGTLFLDEIGDMSLNMQVKLLRALETQTISPLGSSELIKVDVRIITATSKNLKEMILSGAFREDLYHRINTLMIEIPPLRKRKEDIPHLCTYFLKKKKIQKKISHSAMDKLLEYNWPGNIRELKSTIVRSYIKSGLEKEIRERHIVFY